MSLEKAARDVLRHYPIPGLQVLPLQPHSGFSGATIWEVKSAHARFCLRAWPDRGIAPTSLAAIHRLMQSAKHLSFIPQPITGRQYQTVFVHEGRVWDLTTWMPGRADFRQQPTTQKIEAACHALAQLHMAWKTDRAGPCPAIARRLERWQSWTALVESGWKPDFKAIDSLDSWAERAWRQLLLRVPAIRERLVAWQSEVVPLQPCLCDIWHDHVLFTGDEVTGLIDFGSVKLDSVAVDLARMLGSMIGDNEQLRSAGLAAYEKVRPLTQVERDLIPILDEAGVILGAANWLRWLYKERRQYANESAVCERLAALVRRMESW